MAELRSGRAEVQVISRPRQRSVPPPDLPAERLKPLPEGGSGAIVEIDTGQGSFAVDMVPMSEQASALLVQTEVGSFAEYSQMSADYRFGLEHVAPRSGPRSVVVFGDVLQNLELVFGEAGVSRLIINNVNARYRPGHYDRLARGLLRVMAPGGQVEVQWDRSLEGEDPSATRGHIEADVLYAALTRAAPNVRTAYLDTDGVPYP